MRYPFVVGNHSKNYRHEDGRTYTFQDNDFGLTHFRLFAEDTAFANLVLGLNIPSSDEFGERIIPVGMNGRYKISSATRFQTPMAAKAKWISDQIFLMDYNDFSNNHKYTIEITFDGNTALWNLFD